MKTNAVVEISKHEAIRIVLGLEADEPAAPAAEELLSLYAYITSSILFPDIPKKLPLSESVKNGLDSLMTIIWALQEISRNEAIRVVLGLKTDESALIAAKELLSVYAYIPDSILTPEITKGRPLSESEKNGLVSLLTIIQALQE